MVLTASQLGIRNDLIPAFCCDCKDRIGWTDEGIEDTPSSTYCEDCAKKPIEEDENKNN